MIDDITLVRCGGMEPGSLNNARKAANAFNGIQ